MTVRPPRNVPASIRARLLAYAKAQGEPFQRTLTRYAIERLLFRLASTEAVERYVLKGAMLFVTWPEQAGRPTGDLDLLGQGDPDPEAIKAVFEGICAVEAPEDGLVFDPATLRVEAVREADRYQGVQLSLRAELAGAVIPVQVDIGFGDYIHPAPRRQVFPSLLPELPSATLLMYPPETVIAEKFEAMIRFGEANGRIKDFYDIWVTTQTFEMDLPDVVEAVGGTLRRRQTAIPDVMPIGLTAAFAATAQARGLWAGFLRRSPPGLEPPSFPEVQEELRRFFDPVLAALTTPVDDRGRWSAVAGWRLGADA